MAEDSKDILAVPTDTARSISSPTRIDAEELNEARRDERWREFCLNSESYVAETTRPSVRPRQAV